MQLNHITRITIGSVLLVLTASVNAKALSRLTGGVGVINVVRVRTADGEADRFEVFADQLEDFPVFVRLHLSLKGDGKAARTATLPANWYERFSVVVRKDGRETDAYKFQLVPDSQRFQRHPIDNMSSDLPESLAPGEAVYALWRVIGPHGAALDVGTYRFVVHSGSDFEAIFGIRGGIGGEFAIVVKDRTGSDPNRYREDLVERYFLWGVWLYKYDGESSKKQLEKSWHLCMDYLRRGAGDQPNLWNITPRWQASLISGWLDRPKDEIMYLSKLLSQHDTMIANGKECKMRYFHFGRERGALPINVKHDLGRKVNRLYERVYGKTMSGRKLPPMPPVRKRFPGDEDELEDK